MRRILTLTLLFLFISAPAQVQAVEDYSPRSLSLKVFADGVTSVQYSVDVNPTLARVNVTVFGGQIHNLVVEDISGDILNSRVVDGRVVVSVLGAMTAFISYTTPGLTSKNGTVWHIEAALPIEANILLPTSATILFMEPMPLSIGVVGDVTTITMPSSNTSISYVIGVVGTKAYALAVITDAEEAITELASQGIVVDDASSLLEGAWEEYTLGGYVQAEEMAKKAKSDALGTGGSALIASASIETARSAIQASVEAGRTSLIDEANVKLEHARSLYELGQYENATSFSQEAGAIAEESSKPLDDGSTRPPNMGIFLWVIPLGSVAVLFLVFLRRKPPAPVEEAQEDIDLDPIFEAYPQLRMDEREALRFIASTGEGVFVSELRDRFDLPRSSAWRMVRRLEEMGVIRTEKIGRETFLRIKVHTEDLD